MSYTKHYYAGSQRINSKLGKGKDVGLFNCAWLIIPYGAGSSSINEKVVAKEKLEANTAASLAIMAANGITPPPNYGQNAGYTENCVPSYTGVEEKDTYWYHPDHLGSSSFITGLDGEVTQNIEYFPSGEVFVENHKNSYNTPYKFNGKEQDDETGYYYYGARYYNARVSLWLNVDPLAEKTPSFSPYVYALNNPIKYIDPTGMIAEDAKSPNDWVRRKDGSIYWDNKANDQKTTKAGETYMGKTLRIGMDSYIDKKLWDGPNPWFDVSGSKLQSDIWISSEENSKGELTGITATIKSEIMTNKGGFKGVKINSMPDIQSSKNFVDSNGKFIGFNIAVEKHAQVPEFEKFGLNIQGYGPVNVAQRIDVNYIGKDLNISFKTDVFPSASAGIIGAGGPFKLMQYNQPSYRKTHNLMDNGVRKPYLYPRN